jgi:flagellar basal-body rod protein FlgG
MACQQSNIDVVAHNLANVNTNGFKKSRINFQDLMYQNMQTAGTSTASGTQLPVGIQVGMGAKVVSVEKMFSQGDYSQTKNQLDMAIEGKGFFKLVANGKEVYTRSGAFKLDKEEISLTATEIDSSRNLPYLAKTVSITIEPGGKLGFGSDGKELVAFRFSCLIPEPSGLSRRPEPVDSQ